MFLLDIETLSTESTAVVLSAAIVFFNDGMSYDELINSSIFIKFEAKDQIQNYKRTASKSTLEWWNKQSSHAKIRSLNPSKQDVSAKVGIEKLRNYLEVDTSQNKIIWTRGGLDSMCLESLCVALNVPPIVRYFNYYDIRTALNLLAPDTERGYCKVNYPGFNLDVVKKHDPVHDICYDAMQLLYHY